MIILSVPDDIEVIAEAAFSGTQFEKIVLSKDLRFIEKQAFKDCQQLKEVVFNDKLLQVGDNAFYNCKSLKSVHFEKCAYLHRIGKRCFKDCISLEIVCFNDETNDFDKMIDIEEDAFSHCKALKKAILPPSLRKIEKGVFHNCLSLKEINFPEFLSYIGWAAFWGCKELREVDLYNHYVYIDYQAFALCGIEKFILPKNINSLSGMVLCRTKIKELTLPASIKLLGGKSLEIDTLKKVYIKDSKNADDLIKLREYAGIPTDCKIIKC